MAEPRSVLGGASAGEGLTIGIRDRGPVGMVTFKGDLAGGIGGVLKDRGLTVPDVWALVAGDGLDAVWMAPDELLLLTGYADAPGLAAAIDEALGGEAHMAEVVSDARVVMRLEGEGVAEVLAKGAPVDLSPGAFPPGAARRTHLGGLAVAFWRRSPTEWDVIAWRSFARHLFDWLAVSARRGGEVGVFPTG